MQEPVPKFWPFPTYKGKPVGNQIIDVTESAPVFDSKKSTKQDQKIMMQEQDAGLF